MMINRYSCTKDNRILGKKRYERITPPDKNDKEE